jgi:hypothetical protein
VRASRITLGFFFVCFVVLAAFYVPRLANPLWSDAEFTGWVSPIAHRMVAGQHIYRDFTLPIPPGSFLLLAAVQRLLHRFLLLDELWVCAISHMAMVAIAYAMVRPFGTARTAVLAAVASMPLLVATPKEIAYDQTAQVVAWATLALLARALCCEEPPRRHAWLRGAGFAAAFTNAVKSSTGVGAVLGALLAMAAVTLVLWRRGGRQAARSTLREWTALLSGMALGAMATALVVALAGGSLAEFWQVVFVDGPDLKGGRPRMVLNLISYAVFQSSAHFSFASAAIVSYLVVRLVGRADGLLVPAEPFDETALERGKAGVRFAVAVSAFVACVFAIAIGLLASDRPTTPFVLRAAAGFGMVPPMVGLVFLAAMLVGNLRAAGGAFDRRLAFGATALAAGSVSLLHNLSHPQHRPFYDNNPIVPLAIFAALVATEQAHAPVLRLLAFGLTVMTLFGDKFQRYLDARHPVADRGFWLGLKVSESGKIVEQAARRVRELAGRNGTVFVLPEDPAFEALVGRPRPALRSAIVFVDQFPEHVLDHDLGALHANPPEVLVLHPAEPVAWNRVYRIWTLQSPAARLQNDFLEKKRDLYRTDTTYATWCFGSPATMEVLVRKPPEQEPEPAR